MGGGSRDPGEPASSASSAPTALWIRWLPALAAFAIFAQVCLLGLRPALAESRRLRDAEARMDARYTAAVDEQQALDRTLRAQEDPIYLERERKYLRVPGSDLRR